jgi:tRNA-Thr(GGU) m(6)t(6)A37 methyltransferase TsaA
MTEFNVYPIGYIRSALVHLESVPRQGPEGAPEARIDLLPEYGAALNGVVIGDEIIVLAWLHLADRATLTTHPRNDAAIPRCGVFATRSPARPNPIGLHRVRVLAIGESSLRVAPMDAIDRTPVIDIKIALDRY